VLLGKRFSLRKLAVQADKEGKTVEEIVNEVVSHVGEVFDDEET